MFDPHPNIHIHGGRRERERERDGETDVVEYALLPFFGQREIPPELIQERDVAWALRALQLLMELLHCLHCQSEPKKWGGLL